MKSLKDTIENELISGKQLFEKLKLKNIRKTISLDIPKFEDMEMTDEVFTIDIPYKKYFIYKDYYRGKMVHLASIDDMCVNLSMFSFDFEDFNPTKDILFASDDEHEIAEWYIINIFGCNLPESQDDWEEWYYHRFDDKKAKYKYHDNEYFIFNLFFGEDSIDQYYDQKKPFNSETLKEIIKQYF